MRTELTDAAGRSLLHDVCRTLLPRADGIKFEPLHAQIMKLARQVLALREPPIGVPLREPRRAPLRGPGRNVFEWL